MPVHNLRNLLFDKASNSNICHIYHILNGENAIKKRFAYILLARRVLVNKMIAKTKLKLLVQCQSLLFLNQDAPYCSLSTFRVIDRKEQ